MSDVPRLAGQPASRQSTNRDGSIACTPQVKMALTIDRPLCRERVTRENGTRENGTSQEKMARGGALLKCRALSLSWCSAHPLRAHPPQNDSGSATTYLLLTRAGPEEPCVLRLSPQLAPNFDTSSNPLQCVHQFRASKLRG